VEGKTCTLTAAGNWRTIPLLSNLPTLSSDYKTQYTYTVEETAISPIDSEKSSSKLSDYTVTYSGGAITNTLTAIETEKTDFEVYKNWIGPVPAGSLLRHRGSRPHGTTATPPTGRTTLPSPSRRTAAGAARQPI
jgi:hypothetical protein